MKQILFAFFLGLATIASPALAQSNLPATSPVATEPNVTPAQQSKCEIRANRFVTENPHADPMSSGFMIFGSAPPPSPPSTYRDPVSGVTFNVASDGRHLSATDSHGTQLWLRNPFVDTDMCPYRSAHPYIYWIGAPGGTFGRHYLGPFNPTPDKIANEQIMKALGSEAVRGRKVRFPEEGARFIGLSFNSSQFGYVDIANGDFYEMGQD